jgi:TRAP-type mannitol/chloroaromatic compound transport system permease small subunit
VAAVVSAYSSKSIIELCGNTLLVLPFLCIVIVHGIDFTLDAIRVNEHSDSPSGLPYRWIIKAVIPLSFTLLALGILSRILRDIHQLKIIYKEKSRGY